MTVNLPYLLPTLLAVFKQYTASLDNYKMSGDNQSGLQKIHLTQLLTHFLQSFNNFLRLFFGGLLPPLDILREQRVIHSDPGGKLPDVDRVELEKAWYGEAEAQIASQDCTFVASLLEVKLQRFQDMVDQLFHILSGGIYRISFRVR